MRLHSVLLGLIPILSIPIVAACGNTTINAGEYTVFRIAFGSEGVRSGACGPVDPNPTTTHSSTFRSGATFLAYGVAFSDGDELFLDVGGQVLTGSTPGDGTYEFKGNTTDTEELGGEELRDSDHDGIDDADDTEVDADGDGIDDKLNDQEVDTDADGDDDRFEDDLVDADGDLVDDRIVYLPGNTVVTKKTDLVISFTLAGTMITGKGVQTSVVTCDGECDGFDALDCSTTTEFVGVEVDPDTAEIPIDDAGAP